MVTLVTRSGPRSGKAEGAGRLGGRLPWGGAISRSNQQTVGEGVLPVIFKPIQLL